jgi:hypothetical protein
MAAKKAAKDKLRTSAATLLLTWEKPLQMGISVLRRSLQMKKRKIKTTEVVKRVEAQFIL